MRRPSPQLLAYLLMALLVAAPLLALSLGTVQAGPPRQSGGDSSVTPESDYLTFVLNVRLDLETLADAFNAGVRPEGWRATTDPSAQSFLGDLLLDLEGEADLVFESIGGVAGARPPEWIGANSQDPLLIARNMRHDLELLAEQVFGINQRPDAWIGARRIYSCDRTLQNLVTYLGRLYDYVPEEEEFIFDYCGAVALDALDVLVEQNVVLPDENVPQLLANLRGDLERLGDEYLGRPPEYTRPEAWRGTGGFYGAPAENLNQLANDLLADLELLARIVAEDKAGDSTARPIGWIGDLGATPGIYSRNLRNDLELLADFALADPVRFANLQNGRPFGWVGTMGLSDLAACQPEVQGLAEIMSTLFGYEIAVSAESAGAYCTALGSSVNAYAETNPEQVAEAPEEGRRSDKTLAFSEYAFAYLDLSALQYMGIMPRGVEFEAWYRNFGESQMMYVVGDNFAVYINREWSSLSQEQFYFLPTLDGIIPETYCFAEWCLGPGPTPTPTGFAPTPTPGGAPGEPPGGPGDRLIVPWNQIAVFYDQDLAEQSAAQVRLELCPDSSLLAGCEPVQQIYDQAGNPISIVNVIGPYPVFQLPYGYSNTYILQSDTYYANEVWISDPTLRGATQSN